MEQQQPEERREPARRERKPYRKPELSEHGQVAMVTQGGYMFAPSETGIYSSTIM